MTTETTEKHDHEQEQRQHINVRINGTHYKVESKLLTGAELYTLAGIPTGNQLFLEVPGEHNDRPITADAFYDEAASLLQQ